MQDRVYEAIETIKGYCAKNKTCKTCGFKSEETTCMFYADIPPCDWNVEGLRFKEAKV